MPRLVPPPRSDLSPDTAVTAALSQRERSRSRLWRIAFLVYALALTTGTHWPKLRVESAIPSSDKIIHFLAFGGLMYLLWRTQWIARLWMVAGIAIAWTALDEITQAIPGLGRTPSLADVIAGEAGVLAAVAVVWWMTRRVAARAGSRR